MCVGEGSCISPMLQCCTSCKVRRSALACKSTQVVHCNKCNTICSSCDHGEDLYVKNMGTECKCWGIFRYGWIIKGNALRWENC